MTHDPTKQLMEHYGKTMVDSVREFNVDEYTKTTARFQKVYEPLVIQKEARVLDVGCGDGHFLHYLKSRGLTHLNGIDSSEDRLERCREHVTPNVYKADAFEFLSQHPGAYDLVSCNHMIEHFTDPTLYTLMERLVGAMAPGGQLLITTPNATTPWAGHTLYTDLTHVRLFSTDSLTQLLNVFGIEAQCYPEEPVAYDLGTTLRWILWKLWKPWIQLSFRVQVGGTRSRQKTPFLVSANIYAIGRKRQ